MIIVKAQGGLGNQMYQYALYKWYVSQGRECKISLNYFNQYANNICVQHDRKYLVDEIFNTHSIFSEPKEDSKLGPCNLQMINKLSKFFHIKKKNHFVESAYKEQIFDESVINIDNVFLDGYWQSIRYIDLVKDILRQEFVFKKELEGRNKELQQLILHNPSISIHVRRGDYLVLNNYIQLDSTYYNSAVQYVINHESKPIILCFSDDIEWCRSHIKYDSIIYVDWNKGDNSYIDMQLMSCCKHNIVANSSFSFWGAWLNSNPNKIVIRPHNSYKNSKEAIDRWPNEWVVF